MLCYVMLCYVMLYYVIFEMKMKESGKVRLQINYIKHSYVELNNLVSCSNCNMKRFLLSS